MSKVEENIDIISKLPFVKTIFIIQVIVYSIGIPAMLLYQNNNVFFDKEDIWKLLLLLVSSGCVTYLAFFTISWFIMLMSLLKSNGASTPNEVFGLAAGVINFSVSLTVIINLIFYYCGNKIIPVSIFLGGTLLLVLISSVLMGTSFGDKKPKT